GGFRVYVCGRVLLLFFFFQAEDGIRDRTVTGVQTCALPIYRRALGLAGERAAEIGPSLRGRDADDPVARTVVGCEIKEPVGALRSEERRVGKECRSRGWRDAEKKNGKHAESATRIKKVDRKC